MTTTRTPINPNQTDAGSPIDEQLMDTNIRKNDVNHEERILALENASVQGGENGVVSSAMRNGSMLPDFIRADGTTNECDILIATTPLVLNINNQQITYQGVADITVTGLDTAPTSNNTCLVNDINMSSDKYAGEDGTEIIIDTVGTEISSRVGSIQAFRHGGSPNDEYFIAYIKDGATLSNAYRGFFFDENGNGKKRQGLSNNDIIYLMALTWIFAKDDSATIEKISSLDNAVSYGFSAPITPSDGDRWFDAANKYWKKYDIGTTSWIDSESTFIGWAVTDTANTEVSRSIDATKDYKDDNTLELELQNAAVIKSKQMRGRVNVYGELVEYTNDFLKFDMTSDFESGMSETVSSPYYLYLDIDRVVISDYKPYYRPDLRGSYHPFEAWRCVGSAYNDASSDLVNVIDEIQKIFTYKNEGSNNQESYMWLPFGQMKKIKAIAFGGGGSGGQGSAANQGGGGGGGGACVCLFEQIIREITIQVGRGGIANTNNTSESGYNSTFGSYITSSGGGGGGKAIIGVGAGGSGGTVTKSTSFYGSLENGSNGITGAGGGGSGHVYFLKGRGGAGSSTTGFPGESPGGGGESGDSGGAYLGGNGGDGIVVIEILN